MSSWIQITERVIGYVRIKIHGLRVQHRSSNIVGAGEASVQCLIIARLHVVEPGFRVTLV